MTNAWASAAQPPLRDTISDYAYTVLKEVRPASVGAECGSNFQGASRGGIVELVRVRVWYDYAKAESNVANMEGGKTAIIKSTAIAS